MQCLITVQMVEPFVTGFRRIERGISYDWLDYLLYPRK